MQICYEILVSDDIGYWWNTSTNIFIYSDEFSVLHTSYAHTQYCRFKIRLVVKLNLNPIIMQAYTKTNITHKTLQHKNLTCVYDSFCNFFYQKFLNKLLRLATCVVLNMSQSNFQGLHTIICATPAEYLVHLYPCHNYKTAAGDQNN